MKNTIFFLACCFVLLASGCKTDTPTTVVKPKILGWHEVTDTTFINIPQCLQYPPYYFYSTPDTIDTLTKSTNGDPSDTCYQLTYFINDTNHYMFLNSDFYQPCNLPIIDFSRYTLIGSYINSFGARGIITRSIKVNDSLKSCKYDILLSLSDTIEFGLLNSMNWVLIPKIPNDYNIQYNTKRIRHWR